MEAEVHKRRKLDTATHATNSSDAREEDHFNVKHTPGTTFKVPGLIVTNHHFKVPLDYSGNVPGEIDIFVRELVAPVAARRTLPYLLYLQGGPGFESPRPTEASGWIKSAINGFRVVLLDQRGTGKSSAITTRNLQRVGSPEQQAEYLALFRADNIVRDCEAVRKKLVPKDNYMGRWSLLGQSFGGFCITTYLSFHPEGIVEAMLTGGLPPLVSERCSAEAVYRSLIKRVVTQNARYYARFPTDVALVARIVKFLEGQPEGGLRLPSGTLLTPRLLQGVGLHGLGSGGGFDRLHYLLDSFFDADGDVTPSFIKSFEAFYSWETNPLYALLHEAIYCQGAGSASRWAAQRVRDLPEYRDTFDAVAAAKAGRPVHFTGEMVFPWMFDDVAALRPYKAAAELLAQRSDWPLLYSAEQLQFNKLPVAAVSYVEDVYVDFELARGTADTIQGLRHWMTNEYKHTGIRDDGCRIFERLLNMIRDSILLE